MPIEYTVSPDGNFIHAVASDPLTGEEFVEYEVAHAIDERIKPPVSELIEVGRGALRNLTKEDISKVLERRKEVRTPHTQHRCAITVPHGDVHGWELAKFYEGMVILHSPEVVIVFGDSNSAARWLGFDEYWSNEAFRTDNF